MLQNLEYSITPHKHELVCKQYKHSGGGPVRSGKGSNSLGLPTGMLGKQVGPDWGAAARHVVCAGNRLCGLPE